MLQNVIYAILLQVDFSFNIMLVRFSHVIGFNNMLQFVCYNQILVSLDVLLFYTTALDKTFKINFLLSKLGIIIIMILASQGGNQMSQCMKCQDKALILSNHLIMTIIVIIQNILRTLFPVTIDFHKYLTSDW